MSCSVERNIKLPCTLNKRISDKVVSQVGKLTSSIILYKDNRHINLKSVLGLFSANCTVGEEVLLISFNEKEKCLAESDLEKVIDILTQAGEM